MALPGQFQICALARPRPGPGDSVTARDVAYQNVNFLQQSHGVILCMFGFTFVTSPLCTRGWEAVVSQMGQT